MADTEFNEAGRAELIQRIAAALLADQEIKLSSVLWAFLWLADYSCLEKIERDLADPVILAKFASLMRDVLLPWLCKSKNQSTMATPIESVANTPTGDYARKRPRLSVDTTAESSSPETPTRSSFPQFPSSGPSTPNQSGRNYRDPKLRELTLERDSGCVITKIENLTVIEHAHIYPNSLGPAGERQAFWEQLKLFWPQKQVEQWYYLLGTLQGTERLVNTIGMNVLVHKAWGAALFALKHLNTSEDKRFMKVQFYWLRPGEASKAKLTVEEFLKKPLLSSDEQCGEGSLYLFNVRTHQPIKSGDIITLSTLSPLTMPLPSEELINLQWNLHRIAALSAAAIDHELEIMGDDDDDDYDEDLY